MVIENSATIQLCSRKQQSVLHLQCVGPLHHSNGPTRRFREHRFRYLSRWCAPIFFGVVGGDVRYTNKRFGICRNFQIARACPYAKCEHAPNSEAGGRPPPRPLPST